MRKFVVGALALGLLAAGIGGASAKSAVISLKPSAGSCNGTGVGNGQNAQAQWTNKKAETGKFSVLLQKSAATGDCSFAAIVVKGVEGMTIPQVDTLGFAVNGPCTNGSPRFNLFYDNNGDGQYDGYNFYGCGNHVSGVNGDWTHMTADANTPDFTVGDPAALGATVVQLAVIVDEQGTYYIDNVMAAGATAGEPSA